MAGPLAISFPVVRCPAHVGTGRAIVLQMQPITPARPDLLPSHGHVIAMLENGRLVRFTITLAEWEAAKRTPVHFVEVDDRRGALGGIVTPAGNPFTPPKV